MPGTLHQQAKFHTYYQNYASSTAIAYNCALLIESLLDSDKTLYIPLPQWLALFASIRGFFILIFPSLIILTSLLFLIPILPLP